MPYFYNEVPANPKWDLLYCLILLTAMILNKLNNSIQRQIVTKSH